MPDPAQQGTLCARIRQSFDGFDLCADITLRPGRITALFGPSGCGKTSLLRVLAGLLHSPRSVVSFGSTRWQEAGRKPLPPHKRPLGVVFQDSSLLPHLSVRQNLFFGAKRQERGEWFCTAQKPPPRQTPVAGDIIARLDLAPLLGRATGQLSGGERQRVALGRALLVRPAVLFLDEPLSALDEDARRALLPCLRGLTDVIPGPIVLITHALDEVMALADDVILMNRGQVLQSGAINCVLSDPAQSLAFREEAATLLSGTLCDDKDGVLSMALSDDFAGQIVHLPARQGHNKQRGEHLRLCAFARDVIPHAAEHPRSRSGHSTVSCKGRVLSITPAPHQEALALLVVQVGTTPLLARVWRHSCRFQVGESISVEITQLSGV